MGLEAHFLALYLDLFLLIQMHMKYDIEDFGYESKLRGCIVDID
uniref:Uncharacterized protein n=1 Tax=Vitis vinifera TaxID=29760 RepID=F6HL91_VITVI